MKKIISMLLTILLVATIMLPLCGSAGAAENATAQYSAAATDAERTAAIEAFVTRLYSICLGRMPDAGGLATWVQRLKSGEMSGAEVAQGFMFSQEMADKKLSNSAYIEILYNAILGRPPEPAGIEAWLYRMQYEGYSMHAVFVGFAESAEFAGICDSYGITTGNAKALKPIPMPAQTPEPKVPGSGETEIPETLQDFAAEVLRLTNEHRAANGLKALKEDNTILNEAAGIRAEEIVSLFSHTRPNGKSCFTAYTDLKGKYNCMGENIASGHKTPEQVVTAWMNSPGHRANILYKDFTHLGVGIFQDTSGRYHWVQLFCG